MLNYEIGNTIVEVKKMKDDSFVTNHRNRNANAMPDLFTEYATGIVFFGEDPGVALDRPDLDRQEVLIQKLSE